jgi:hypothetical protein
VSITSAHPSSPRRRAAIAMMAIAAGILASAVLALLAANALAKTTSCGSINGITIQAHGVSCATARKVYREDQAGHKPHGWVCSAAVHECSKGHLGSSQSVLWSYGQGQGQGQQGQGQG